MFEQYDNMEHGMQRERRIKEWKRDWKIQLIELDNPLWRDLYDDMSL
jgi:putative endonuclease